NQSVDQEVFRRPAARQNSGTTKGSARQPNGEQTSGLRGSRASATALYSVAHRRFQARRRLRAFSDELDSLRLAHGTIDESTCVRHAEGVTGPWFSKLSGRRRRVPGRSNTATRSHAHRSG